MSTIDYLPVATAVGNNADSQVNFAGSGYQTLGFQTGIALPQQANKIFRQTSMMTAALAHFISNTLSTNVLDDGNLPALITLLTNALTAGAGSAPTFQTGGVNNALQSLLNLVAGSNITLANTSGGNVSIAAASITPPAFQTNGVPNALQSLLNLIAGANITLTADVFGGVTIAAASAPRVVISSTYKQLASPIFYSPGAPITVDTITVTMPVSGGPWRAFVSYNYYKNGGVHYSSWTTDGTHSWNGVDAVTSDNQTGFSSGAFSPTTYANGATVSFSTHLIDSGHSTVQLNSVVYGPSPALSNMQVTIMSSN